VDASPEEDMAELRKKMDTMPTNFVNEDERAGLDSTSAVRAMLSWRSTSTTTIRPEISA